MNSKARSYLLAIGYAGIYFGLAKLGLTLATINQSASPVWPATGFAISIVFLFGPRMLLAVALGAFAANYSNGSGLLSAFLISLGNLSEAFIGSFIIHRLLALECKLGFHTRTLAFILSPAIGSLASASIGIATLSMTGSLPQNLVGTVWLTWWIGNFLGGLVLCPVLIPGRKIIMQAKDWLQFLCLVGLAAAAIFLTFYYSDGKSFLFILFPILLISILWMEQDLVAILAAIVGSASIAATVHGFGPFAVGPLNERLIHLQLFLAAFMVTATTISSFGRKRLSRVPTFLLLACWVLSGILFYSFDKSEEKRTEDHFQTLVENAHEKTKTLMASYEQNLRGGVGLFAASNSVELDEWKAYITTFSIEKLNPGINGIGVIWALKPKDLPKFEKELKDQGLKNFSVKPIPGFESSQTDLYVVKFIEPMEQNLVALGLDIGSEPNRRKAAELSRDTGVGAVTSKIVLVQDQQKSPGFLYFLPIFRKKMSLETVESRKKAHIGWVYAPIVFKNFIAEVFENGNEEIELQAFDGKGSSPEEMVFSNFTDKSNGEANVFEKRIVLGQREFTFRWAKSPKFVSSHKTVVAWVGFCSALVTLLLVNLVITIQLVTTRAREIAEELTKELSSSREKFQQGERRLLYALDGSNDGIWDWNIEESEMYVSGKIAVSHGWPQLSKVRSINDLSHFAHPEDLSAIEKSIERLMKGLSESHEVETRYRTKDGEHRWVLTRGKISERNAKGQAKRMTGVHIDIHDFKMAQQDLENTKHQLINIANSVPTVVSLWSKELLCEFANDEFARWFGLHKNEIVGKSLASVLGTDDLDERMPSIQGAIAGEKTKSEGDVTRPRDGASRIAITTYLPSKKNEVIEGFFLFIQDITDLKKAERNAIEERQVAIEAANVKSQFLANMSHEIRTPLNGIMGMTKLLKRTGLNEKQAEYADFVSRSSGDLLNLINDILDFSKAEAGRLKLEQVDFSLRGLISDMMKVMALSASEKKIEFESVVSLGDHDFFMGDPGRIRQILMNLISNAIKFTSHGSVVLKVTCQAEASSAKIHFEVTDSGIGIPEHVLGKLFQAFSQADASTTRRYGGTGLGLSICKQLVELMDGKIGVQSKPGEGSVFWFSIDMPYGKSVEKSEDLTTVERSEGARILVAEDNPVNQQIASEMLEGFGYIPTIVDNGAEVLVALRNSGFHLILMDCQMPGMDGYQATKAIRESTGSTYNDIPIIAVTANALEGDREKCLMAGMNDYISKPFDEHRLVYLIESHLKNQNPMKIPLAKKSQAERTIIQIQAIDKLNRLQKPGRPSLVANLIDLFFKSAKESIAEIKKSSKQKNLPAIASAAHAMKSSAANLGALRFAEICLQLENCGNGSAPAENLDRVVEELEAEFNLVLRELERLKPAA